MQVPVVQNINSSVGFKSNDDLEKANAFVKMDDAQLKRLAAKISYNKKEQKEKTRKTIMATFWAIPAFDILANGVLAKNAVFTEGKDVAAVVVEKATPLSTKAHSALRSAGTWGLALGVFALYKSIKRAVAPESENPKNRRFKNPVTSILIDIGLMLGGITLLSAGIRDIMKQFPEKIDKMKNKYVEKLSKLDKTNFNTKTMPELRKLAEKFPRSAATGRFLLANSIWIILGMGIYKLFNNSFEERKKIDKTYRELKVCQNQTAKALDKISKVKNDSPAQEDEILVIGMKKTISDEEILAIQKEIKVPEKEKTEKQVKQSDGKIAKTPEKDTETKSKKIKGTKQQDDTESLEIAQTIE